MRPLLTTMAKKKFSHKEIIVPVSELKEFPGNPNKHPEPQIRAMAENMKRFGQYLRIITDENYLILSGHGKKRSLELAGMKEAKINMISGMSEIEKKVLLLADNRIQEMSTIHMPDLEAIIKQAATLDIPGFSQDYIDSVINELTRDNYGVDLQADMNGLGLNSQGPGVVGQIDQDTNPEKGKVYKEIECPYCKNRFEI